MPTPPFPDIDPQDIDIIAVKFLDAQNNPGFAPAFTLDEAEEAGAFREEALSEEDARESSAVDQF